MSDLAAALDVELIRVIVNYGLGSRVVRSAKQHGLSGGTIVLGKGTVASGFLNFIGLCDVRKEIVYLAGDSQIVSRAMEEMNKEFELSKPNHGIAFTTSICSIIGSRSIACRIKKEDRGAEKTMYHIINIIVDKGRAEEVVSAATKAGSKGGTVINARGSGVHETSKVFDMEIEPEKEVIIILSEVEKTEDIVASIRESLQIDEPGNGIIYVQETSRTYGIFR